MNESEVRQLEAALPRVWEVAQRFGLDPYAVSFEIVPATIMYEFGAYGLPGRFSHWTHGRAYHQIKTEYDYGLSRIYELVINTDPSYAFLLDNNSVLQNTLVAAHVLAHVDFFKNNAFFQPTDRRMVETASAHADRIRRYEFRHGRSQVEEFLDAVLSIHEHVDPHVFIRRPPPATDQPPPPRAPGPFDDLFTLDDHPPGVVGAAADESESDLLRYIAEHARHLEDWQRDVIDIVRSEQLYFVPQMRTKIMNEGWATYWHLRIMRELDLPTADYLDFARMHAGVVTPNRQQINPYYLGLRVLEDVERRWNEPTAEERQRRHRTPGEGRAKLFDLRATEDDASFLRNYLTEELVEELDLYLYRKEGEKWIIVDKNWERVRDVLVASVVNHGRPQIVIADGDYRKNGELYLLHADEDRPLDLAYAEKTLPYVYRLWGRSVHLETTTKDGSLVLTYDGSRGERRSLTSAS